MKISKQTLTALTILAIWLMISWVFPTRPLQLTVLNSGISAEVWPHRSHRVHRLPADDAAFAKRFAHYSAPPTTLSKILTLYLLSPIVCCFESHQSENSSRATHDFCARRFEYRQDKHSCELRA